MRPRRTGRTQQRAVAQHAAEVDPSTGAPGLQFDFSGRPVSRPAARPADQGRRDDSIKQAIIRWLNEQL